MSSGDKQASGVSWTGDMSSFMEPGQHKIRHVMSSNSFQKEYEQFYIFGAINLERYLPKSAFRRLLLISCLTI